MHEEWAQSNRLILDRSLWSSGALFSLMYLYVTPGASISSVRPPNRNSLPLTIAAKPRYRTEHRAMFDDVELRTNQIHDTQMERVAIVLHCMSVQRRCGNMARERDIAVDKSDFYQSAFTRTTNSLTAIRIVYRAWV